VIRALGRDEELARGAIRFSFGKDNTEADVDQVVDALARAVESLRKLSPLKANSTSNSETQVSIA
jgi:cysteine desulfurase